MEIVSREEWGARDPRSVTTLRVPTKDLILHHAGSSGGGAARVRAIQRFHMDSRGWRDIAYHYLIDDDGTIFEGRGGGNEGGATFGENDTSHAICLLGNFNNENPTSSALGSLIDLTEWGHDKGWWPRQITGGHRDFRPTSCPGSNLYQLIPEINRQLEEDMTPEQARQLEEVYAHITDEIFDNPANPTPRQAWMRTYLAASTALAIVKAMAKGVTLTPEAIEEIEAQFSETFGIIERD